MKNELTIWQDSKELAQVKEAFGKSLTINEWTMFLQIGKSLNLNPFMREIYAVKYGSNCNIFIGRDGYRRVAQEQPQYNGHIVESIYEKDEFSIVDGRVHHKFNFFNRGKLVGAYCEVYRKDLATPIRVMVQFSEYNTNQSIWKSKPETMIKKVAESQALRMAFQGLFSGTYNESEQWENKQSQPKPQVKKPTIEFTTEKEIIPEYTEQEINDAEAEFMQEQESFDLADDQQPDYDLIDRVQDLLISERISDATAKKLQSRIEAMYNAKNQAELDLLEKIIFRFERDKNYEPLTQSQLRLIKAKDIKLPESITHARLLSKDEASKLIDNNQKGE